MAEDTDKCCCPIPEPLAPFVRPTGTCDEEFTFTPLDTRIPTIVSGKDDAHYVYSEMDTFYYDVGSVDKASAWFGQEQTVPVAPVCVQEVDPTKNYVVSQPNVNL